VKVPVWKRSRNWNSRSIDLWQSQWRCGSG